MSQTNNSSAYVLDLMSAERKQTVFIKTITNYFVGKVVATIVNSDDEVDWVCLFPAAWIADQGIRQSEFLKKGVTDATERERYEHPVWVRWITATEAVQWRHEVPESNDVEPEEMARILAERPAIESKYRTEADFHNIIGEKSRVFVKSATNFFIGDIAAMELDQDGDMARLVLEPGSAWVADQGVRQSRFLSLGTARDTEIERYEDPVLINSHLLTEITPWPREIPETSTREESGSVQRWEDEPDDEEQEGPEDDGAEDDGAPF